MLKTTGRSLSMNFDIHLHCNDVLEKYLDFVYQNYYSYRLGVKKIKILFCVNNKRKQLFQSALKHYRKLQSLLITN